MARNITNIFSISSSIRQLMTISNNVINPIRLLRTSTYCENARRKEDNAYQSSNKRKLTFMNNSLEINKLRACSSQQEIFQYIKENNKNMNGLEALEIMTKLFILEKTKQIHNNSVAQTKEFSMLCSILKSNIRQLSEANALQALKVLNYFQVPASTVIVQMVLQIIRNSINNLSIEQILFLIFLLSKCQKTPLSEALSIALPIVLESCIKSQIDFDNIDTLTNLLQHLVKRPNKCESLSTILNALNNKDISLFTTNQAKVLLASIANLNPHIAVTELLKKCQQVLTNSMSDMKQYDLKSIQRILTENYRNSDDLFYNENFLDAYATAVISKDMGFDFAVETLARCNEFHYTHDALLEYVTAKCCECQNEANMIDNRTCFILLRAISNSDYKQVLWETVKTIVMNERLLEVSRGQLINISIYLASLDCYWPELLAKIFTADYIKKPLSAKLKKKFLFIYSIVKTSYPEYTGPWPSDNLIQMFVSSSSPSPYNDTNFPLKSALECVIGDHAIIMRKGGFPIAVNNSDEATPSTIEELQPPENSQVILLIRIPDYGYIRNTQRLTGFWSLFTQTLKTETNYTIIPINGTMWEKMTEHDQVKYLSQEIRLKSDKLSAITNS
ncbi:hypothetical protein PV325_003796 [Microctonus aethiopoides]|nr:hypothetical protein PV325_003796 [Microctonus aethiopoides]